MRGTNEYDLDNMLLSMTMGESNPIAVTVSDDVARQYGNILLRFNKDDVEFNEPCNMSYEDGLKSETSPWQQLLLEMRIQGSQKIPKSLVIQFLNIHHDDWGSMEEVFKLEMTAKYGKLGKVVFGNDAYVIKSRNEL